MPRAIQFKTEDGVQHTIIDHSVDAVCSVCSKNFNGSKETGGAIFGESLVCKKCAIAIIKIRKHKPVEVCPKDELFSVFALRHATWVGDKILKIIKKHGEMVDSDPEEFPKITEQTLGGDGYKAVELSKSDGYGPTSSQEDDWESTLGWGDSFEDREGESWKNGEQEEWSGD